MSSIPSELRYASSHEWVQVEEGGVVAIGITDHAQQLLGDVVFVELPEVGTALSAGDEVGVVESVKAASDIYAPVSGEVVAVNEELDEAPETVNSAPYTDGWIFKLKLSDQSELESLLDADGYSGLVESEG